MAFRLINVIFADFYAKRMSSGTNQLKKDIKRKIINDPVFGFINIPNDFIYEIIQHPYFQRLNRIKQLGLSFLVYPGAEHTRFLHSLGAMHLMGEAINQLRLQGLDISDEEADAAKAAILLHDIGHGPFSHVLENTLVHNISHETISLLMLEEINKTFNGKLDKAIAIFQNQYDKPFLHQLVSGQLDVDRLDYLCRDSFFCGVSEGMVGSARILKMLHVKDGKLVVEAKGIYSIEKFLVARRLMYWQVYLHKTSVAAEKLLTNILKRAKTLAAEGAELFCSPALHYFLYHNIDKEQFINSAEALGQFVSLDDSDIVCAIKIWTGHSDIILSTLCKAFINRNLFKVEIQELPFDNLFKENKIALYATHFGINKTDAEYFIGEETVSTDTYDPSNDRINILYKDGSIKDIADASDMLNISVLTKKVEKYYFCYYKI